MKATVLYGFVCMIFEILVWEFFLVQKNSLCTPAWPWHSLNSWEGQQMFLSPGCLWVPAMKVTRQTGAKGDPQLPATKLMEWKSHEIHLWILSQEIRKMHLSLNVHGGNFWIAHFFDHHSSATWKNSCNVRSWMTLRRMFPRSNLMIRRMKVPWSQESWSF